MSSRAIHIALKSISNPWRRESKRQEGARNGKAHSPHSRPRVLRRSRSCGPGSVDGPESKANALHLGGELNASKQNPLALPYVLGEHYRRFLPSVPRRQIPFRTSGGRYSSWTARVNGS